VITAMYETPIAVMCKSTAVAQRWRRVSRPINAARKASVPSGGGLDAILASRLVGETGRLCGIDLTPEMAQKAQINFVRAGADNVEAVVAASEAIPYEDNTFDIVTSNGVLNLSPIKEQSFC
jgi:arsenite methyltransferase